MDSFRLVKTNAIRFENEKKFSVTALSYGAARLDTDEVMSYCVTRVK